MEFEAHPAWTLRCKYFADVSNAEDLGAYIISGKCPERTSLINARLIPGLMALYAAGDKTLRALGTDKGIATRTMGSELVYNLSGSKHISESLRRLGSKRIREELQLKRVVFLPLPNTAEFLVC